MFKRGSLGSASLFLIASLNAQTNYEVSFSSDFRCRDALPQTGIPRDEWETCCGVWGPQAATFPIVKIPNGVEASRWIEGRVIAVAKKYIGLPYKHKHIPFAGGLDCSNFTSWVYNYGFGVRFDSNIERQADNVGRKLGREETLNKGDLIFLWNRNRTRISHVAIFIDSENVIDERGSGVEVRSFQGEYLERFAWARRIFE